MNFKLKFKNQHTSNFIILITITMLFFCIAKTTQVFAYDIPSQTDAFYVNDTIDLIDSEKEDYIISTNEELYAKTGAQVVVAIIQNLNDVPIEEYSTEMFRKYGIGNKDKNNGVLILLSIDDRECRIEVGYGLEGAINDAKAGRIMDNYMIPYFRDDKWDEGIINGFDAVLDEICKEYSVEITHNEARISSEDQIVSDEDEYNKNTWTGVIAGIIGLISGLIIGKGFPKKAFIPGIIFLVLAFIVLCNVMSIGWAIMSFILVVIAFIIGWAITSPEISGSSGGYSSSSYNSGRDYSYRTSSSSSSNSSSRNYGGGGRSGGGGASRKF